VLCIECGYHLPSGTFLATEIERSPATEGRLSEPELNPYAAPSMEAAPVRRGLGSATVLDLTPTGARRAKAVVQDADNVYLAILLATCICGIAWLFMFPWFGFRLLQWYQLNSQFEELRHPNAFSPHAEFTSRFPDAKLKLWIGTIVGGGFFLLLIVLSAWPRGM
jgi:hypothetical protein